VIIAALLGLQIMDFLFGSLMGKRLTYFWILAAVIAAGMLLPHDLSLDISHLRRSLKSGYGFRRNYQKR
jgi:hypothetical protein